MAVKVLQRRHNPMIPNLESPPPQSTSFFSNFGKNLAKHKKSASGQPLTIGERISDFIAFNKPNVNLGAMGPLLQKLKIPSLIIAGISFVAGLAYLAYRLYSNWSDKKANETIEKIMKDFSETTPDLLKLPGWYDQVKNEVTQAVRSGNDKHMVEQITKIKTAMIEKQKSMGHAVGSGFDLFEDSDRRIGRGIIMPF
jgi:hypothetical protein